MGRLEVVMNGPGPSRCRAPSPRFGAAQRQVVQRVLVIEHRRSASWGRKGVLLPLL